MLYRRQNPNFSPHKHSNFQFIPLLSFVHVDFPSTFCLVKSVSFHICPYNIHSYIYYLYNIYKTLNGNSERQFQEQINPIEYIQCPQWYVIIIIMIIVICMCYFSGDLIALS